MPKNQAQNKSPQRRLLLGGTLVLLVFALLAGAFYLHTKVTDQFGPPAPTLSMVQRIIYPVELFINQASLVTAPDQNGPEQVFGISQDESVSLVCIRLEQAGLIRDAELFRIYLVYSGLDRHLQSGKFTLSSAMSPIQIAAAMLDATPTEAVISILPGWRIEEIAANVGRSGLQITAEDFIAAAYQPSPAILAYLPVDEVSSLEGFLFPGTYSLPREADLEMVFATILTTFSQNVNQDLLDGFSRQGLSLDEGVTLASIIEKEAVVDDEKPLVASVFFNRLVYGMRLETDPTVQYSLGYQTEAQTWWKSPLRENDLSIDSPYNTYVIFGLPPTPICNPDLTSLRAAAYPAETPYYFFRAACDGSGRHNFAITFEEHLNNSCE